MNDRYLPAIVVLSGLALICVSAQSRASGDGAAPELSADARAFLSMVQTYRGKVFCAPSDTTIGDAATVVKRYVAQHPELAGRYSDQQALAALAAAYPCPLSPGSNLAHVPLDQMGGRKLEVSPSGEYATIDTQPDITLIQRLRSGTGADDADLAAQVTQTPGNYTPPVLFALSEWYYKRGQPDDAIFWLNAGGLRALFDAAICTDPSARSAIAELAQKLPADLYRQEFRDPQRFKRIVDRVVEWDARTPATYDHRWISLHGLNAINSSIGASTAPGPLTVSRDRWIAIAQHNRQQYRTDMYQAADRNSAQPN
jgi:Rap1a immunity proteins